VIDKGVLQYAKPDKGLFRIDNRQTLSKKGPTPEYRPSDKFGDYWVCDGEYLHIRDRNELKALKIQLPPNQRHNGIHNSPLPFLFGVKAEEIKTRYWIRPVAPPAGSQDVWLEAWPKQLDDAGNYSRVQVVLDANEVLPKALIVFLPNWEPQSPHREVLEFTDRKQDWNLVDAMKQKLFMKDFIDTNLPSTWQVIVEPYMDPQETQQATSQAQQRVAQPPATQQQLR
jgi:TIGR03009 family protein